jgi:hypothetical protein
MRHAFFGMAAAALATAVSAAPAAACPWGFAWQTAAIATPCGYAGGYGGGYAAAAVTAYEHLPEPQYYYVNQGPTYTGPGQFAPVPTYQQAAVSGWSAYNRPYYSGYNGGPYGNAMTHYYDGMPAVRGPVVYRYRPAAMRYGYPVRRYGYTSRVIHSRY